MSSDNVDLAFNYLDARVARLRQYLEKLVEDGVMQIHRATANRQLSQAVADAVKKAEKKNSQHLYKVTYDNVVELENEVIKTFHLPDDKPTRIGLRSYIHEKINA